MSLTSAMNTGVSGLLTQAEGINVIGNNIANVNTTGFKGSRTLFSDMLSGPAANNSQIGRGVQVQKIDNLFGAGPTTNTGNVLDVAIQGEGFFVLGVPATAAGATVNCENAYYTKAGAFRLDETGFGLENADGYKLLDAAGMPIIFPQVGTVSGYNFQKITGINSTGVISALYSDAAGLTATEYYGGNGVTVAAGGAYVNIAQAKIPNPQGLVKQGGTLYTVDVNTSGLPAAAGAVVASTANGTNERLLSNYLEGSNVDMASEMVNMIVTQRAYSANAKTISTSDDMTQEVLSLKR